MADQAGDKKYDATPHRRQQARNQGQVARSQDLVAVALLFAGVSALLFLGDQAGSQLTWYTDQVLGERPEIAADLTTVLNQLLRMVLVFAWITAPLLALLLLVAALGHLFQVGWLLLPEKLMPNVAHINPAKGLKRIFSMQNLLRVTMGLAKMGVVMVVAAIALWQEREKLISVIDLTVPQIARYLLQVTLWTTLKIVAVLLILAFIDFMYQRWKLNQDLRMTEQELRDEIKQTQGDPNLVAMRRMVHRQMVANRLSSSVPDSSVVVTNPTELAIALKYDITKPGAPEVVAKGAGVLAQRIRRLALENNVPIVERKELARALYAEVEVGQQIPDTYYTAVGEVLRYVYELQGETAESLAQKRQAA